jgi:Zn-dependent protease
MAVSISTVLFTGVVQLLVLLLSISAHEAAHAWVADRCGDPTARLLGRVSLNPLRHLDPIGSVLLPLMLIVLGVPVFGFGRPVLVQAKNLRRPYWQMLMVSCAGPAVNLLLALLAVVAVLAAGAALGAGARDAALASVPLPRLKEPDFGRLAAFPLMFTLVRLATVNIFLALFNLLPVPPLDGGQIALQVLPADWAASLASVRPYGRIIGVALALVAVTLVVLPIYGILYLLISTL